jgi:menaquinol-cytochrome c reductase iron-sulfur subunit
MTREAFLGLFTASIGGLAGLAVGIPIIGYVISPVINQPQKVWRDVRLATSDGTPGELVGVDTIAHGQTEKVVFKNAHPLAWDGATARSASWLRRTGPQDFIAFSINCTHLGCPVFWVGDGNIFLCPCHGSVFNGDGTVANGPAARPLTRYPVRVRRGRVQILTEPLPLVY